MATFLFSQIKGTSISFDVNLDVLLFDVGSAADVAVNMSGTKLVLKLGADLVTLQNVNQRGYLSTTNVVFADGSLLLIGDNTSLLTADGSANTLHGSSGNDRLIGLAGNDYLDGGDGSDTYVVTGTADGTDLYRDSGTSGTDRIVAGANNAIIRLGVNFSAGLTGIEAISGNGYSKVTVLGTSGVDTLNFSGVNVTGITLIDASAGADIVTGSAGDDRIKGGLGNDTIDGGAGRDTAVFSGTLASYSVTNLGTTVQVKDLDTVTNGNDGTDTLKNVELLQFLDGVIDLTLPPPNGAPSAVADSATTGEDSAPFVIDVLANDTDPNAGDSKTVIAVNSVGIKGIAQVATGGSGVLYYTNGAHNGLRAGETFTETFNYTMADSAGAQSSAAVTVTVVGVNDAPIAFSDSLTVAANGGPSTINVLSNDTDVDIGDSKTVVSVDGSGTPGWMELILIYGVGVGVWHPGTPAILGTVSVAANGQSIIYSTGNAFASLGAGQTATETILYTMADGSGVQASANVTVTVVGVNDGPSAAADNVSIGKNAAPITVDVLANDTDLDAGDTKKVVSINTTGTLGSVAIAADGSNVAYTVGAAFQSLAIGAIATDTFTYTMVDRAGVQSTALVTMTISGNNAAPLAVADVAAVNENGAPISINVLANDTDADAGDTRTVVSVDGTGLQGSASVAVGGGFVTYTIGGAYQSLRAGQTATETFTYTMRDGAGAQSTASVVVTVTGVNDAPVAVANTAAVAEDAGPVTIDVLANDTDVDAGDSKTIAALNVTGLKGSASIAADGQSVIYTPYQSLRAGQIGTDTFSYTVRDSAGAQSTASVTMTVTGANDGPNAVADAFILTEDAAGTTLSVLANDTDVDIGDTKRVLTVTNAGLLGTVSVAANGAGVVYSAGNAFQHLITGQSATETFSYTMADAAGAQSTATVTVTINGVTDGPKAVNDTASTTEDGGPIVINVLANDTNDQYPGGNLTVTSIDGTGQFAFMNLILIYGVGVGQFFPGFPRLLGQASIAPDGHSIIYTPLQSLNAGEIGTDTFKYTIVGSAGGQSTGVVTVTVSGANDAPTANADSITIQSTGAPVTINVLANDTDPDTRIDPPAPPAGELGPWDVTPVDVPDTKTVVAVDAAGLQGSVAIAPGGTGLVYTPGGTLLNLTFGASATETFTYTMRDSAGAQSSATVTVHLTGVNHTPSATADSASATENGVPIAINVLANDTDADVAAGDSLSLLSVNTVGLQGSAVINGNQVIYTVGNAFQSLGAGATADDVFSYTIADSAGAQSSANVTVKVTGINDAPVAYADSLSLSEDAGPTGIAVLANDIDVDAGDTKTILAVDSAGLQGSVSITADGQALIYTVANSFQSLSTGQSANETFNYTMRDGVGTQSTASVTLTIVGANEPVVYVNPPAPPPGAIQGTAGDDIITGTTAADNIYGHDGDDDITGLEGADRIFGGVGGDTIDGGAGNDVLNGGAGRDDLTGDTGADVFRFYLAAESTLFEFDRVRDFSSAEGDKIDLNLIDANTVLGGNNDFTLTSSFTGTAGELIIGTSASGFFVQGDVNGDAVADLAIEVRTDKGALLTVNDFVL